MATTRSIASEQSQHASSSVVARDSALITIDGFCDNLSADTNATSTCKTVITVAQFDQLIDAVQPNMSSRARREFALRYANALVMARKAEQMGLGEGANYDEQMKLARIQVLSRALNKAIQEKASQISDMDIEDYYNNNKERFEKAELDRVYIPKSRQPQAPATKQDSQESALTMKNKAEDLRTRAVAGEEFTKLQADAYLLSGIKSASPNTRIEVRRTSLPQTQALVMDLSPGEVSSVLTDPNGYVIYKVKTKDTLPLDQAREEIKATLYTQRIQNEMRGIQNSVTPTLDESYFHRRSPLGDDENRKTGEAAYGSPSSKRD